MADPLEEYLKNKANDTGSTGGTPAASGTPKPESRTPRQAVVRAMTNTQLQVGLRMGLISAAEVSEVFGPNKMAELGIDPWGSTEEAVMRQWTATPPEIPAAPTATPAPVAPPPIGGMLGAIAGSTISGTPLPPPQSGAPPAISDAVQPSGGYGSQPVSAYKPTASTGGGSGGSSGGGGSSAPAAPAVPPPPLRDSAQDLKNRGALNVSGTPVLEGQQYAKTNEVVQSGDGQWYILSPQGTPVSGPYPNQTQANTANVYSMLGPAATSNASTNFGQAALQGPNRQKVSQGSGMDQAASIDQMISNTYSKDVQPADFIGAAQTHLGPVDVLRGAIPDYGGMRGVNNAEGMAVGGNTGRINTENGEVAIGTSSIGQTGTQYGSQAQSAFAPYLSQSQIDRIDPAKYNEMILKLGTLREQGLLNQADTAATKSNQAGNYTALTGDPYDLELLPETYAEGGDIQFSPEWQQYLEGEQQQGSIPMPFKYNPTAQLDPSQAVFQPGWNQPPNGQINGVFANWAAQNPPTWGGDTAGGYANGYAEWLPTGARSGAWASEAALDYMPPQTYAQGGGFTVKEPSVIQGLQSGRNYGVMGASPERVTITPTGTEAQQNQAGRRESVIAQMLGGGRPQAPQIPQGGMPNPTPISRPAPPAAWGGELVGGTTLMGTTPDNRPRMIASLRDGKWDWNGRNMPSLSEVLANLPWRDENQNGVDDRDEGMGGGNGMPQTPGIIPNIYAQGGQMNFQPQMPQPMAPQRPGMTSPDVLNALAMGVNKRRKILMPEGLL